MTKSYAGGKDDNQKLSGNEDAKVANDAAKRAEQQVEDIKAEAHDEVKKQQNDME
ncbi:hypothetical protein H9649_05235 [Sporosarcina sp. Sa2YVA2]|uniref:CsbD family protein n=1 Tax=Sporosarcina quadrami TaxID=2762234 RepID=A0ABR8U7G4_9BACL|nr:hypothetical protein [Sporosarcina quadrami]MBD7983973.1 hypothetical protein [Sporosarcina quadrami]